MAETEITLESLAARVAEIQRTAEGTNEAFAQKIDHLTERLSALEEAGPTEVQIADRKLFSHTDLMKDELKELENDPEPHIERRVNFGVAREDAVKGIEQRKAHLRAELGIKVPAARAGRRVAAALAALALALGTTGAGAADYQGYATTLLAPTNLPIWPAATLTNGTAIQYSLASQATNYVPIFTQSGLAVQSIFAGVTNVTGNQVICFYPAVDGTNAFSAPWATLSIATNTLGGTNAAIGGTNWNQLQLRGFAGLFYTVSNACNGPIIVAGAITNVQNGVTNVYPAGLLFSRPNF
jgi:uncharacterized coiled-coil protein SlyX